MEEEVSNSTSEESGAISEVQPKETASTEEQAAVISDAVPGTSDKEPQKEDGGVIGETAEKPDAIDWEKITDDEYLSKVALPDGQQWNKEAMKEYAALLKEHHIDPKVFEKFVAKDAEISKKNYESRKADADKRKAEAQIAFKEAGVEFRKEYSPEQIREINETFTGIDDATFRTLVSKSPLANNKTMGKMILAYRQVYGEDALAGNGSPVSGEKSFEQVWTGK